MTAFVYLAGGSQVAGRIPKRVDRWVEQVGKPAVERTIDEWAERSLGLSRFARPFPAGACIPNSTARLSGGGKRTVPLGVTARLRVHIRFGFRHVIAERARARGRLRTRGACGISLHDRSD